MWEAVLVCVTGHQGPGHAHKCTAGAPSAPALWATPSALREVPCWVRARMAPALRWLLWGQQDTRLLLSLWGRGWSTPVLVQSHSPSGCTRGGLGSALAGKPVCRCSPLCRPKRLSH